MWRRLRLYLWRKLRIPLPAVPRWRALLIEVASVEVYRKDGLVGAPMEWSLYEREPLGRVVPVKATCLWSGYSISGETPIVDEQIDWSNSGVRCARCGSPVHVAYAGMAHSFAPPSCPPCRWLVKLALMWG